MSSEPAEQRPAHELVASNLRVLKATRRVSDGQIAAALGVNRNWVQERMSGSRECKVSDLEALARYFDVPIADLFVRLPWRSATETGMLPVGRQLPVQLSLQFPPAFAEKTAA